MTSPLAIGSANALAAAGLAVRMMSEGADSLDAAVAGITTVEDDPDDLTVGYGGLPNEEGVVELDAAVMHGPTHRAGGVAAMRNVRHASQVARLVMEQTDHTLLVGDGALQFARAHGFREECLLTEKARKIWLYWKQTRSTIDDWLPPPTDQLDPEVLEFFKLADDHHPPRYARSEADSTGPLRLDGRDRPTGTVHLSCRTPDGNISCVTSTSGLAFKIPGRVGDSCIAGAGLYVDNALGSCGSTGRGEANLRALSSFAAVELMRSRSPAEAGIEVLQRIVSQTREARLLTPDGRPNFGLKLYLLKADGTHAGVSLWGPAKYAVSDGKGTSLHDCVALFDRNEKSE